MMDKIPNRPNMIVNLFRERERQRFPHQATDPLPEHVVQALDMARLSAFLADGTMPLRRQHTRIRFPEIGVTDGILAGIPTPSSHNPRPGDGDVDDRRGWTMMVV
jgi:hypothetical protein